MKHVENSSQQVGAFVVDHDFEDEDDYWVCVEVHKGANYKIMDTYNVD
ncbi:hypothetical protein ACIQ7N_19040 [Lysinibacillus sp. NPDC095746]